jgi:choline dehydrogenase-like flavoprotein
VLNLAAAGDEVWERVGGGDHHVGTTRMSDDPKRGVVDRHCRVHGVANLHVAGSAVFPTTGSANPTLSLVALALRLADRLKGAVA